VINKRFKAVIFDLDDTLFDTWSSCYPAAARESCEAMVREGLNCTSDQCVKERENFFKTMPRSDVFQHIVSHFGVNGGRSSDAVAALGKKAFHARQVEKNIRLFSGVKETLAELQGTYMVFLVTSGDPTTQKQKVEILRIREFFTHIYYVNTLLKQRKSSAFMEILEHTDMNPRNVLCVGDRRDREIAEGKRLGFVTCLVRRTHQSVIRPDFPEEVPDFEIDRISELIEKCQL